MKSQASIEFNPSPAILKKARDVMSGYSFSVQPDGEGNFVGWAKQLPDVIADGNTLVECAQNLSFAVETVIASYLQDGQSPPLAERGNGTDRFGPQ